MNTILLVDDDVQMLYLTGNFLKDSGYRVLKARDGLEAQEVITAAKSELATILLDWSMPGMSGIEVLKWLKQQPELEHIPVVMLTGMAGPEHIRQGIEEGAFYYLIKPADAKLIKSIVQAAVADFRNRQELYRQVREGENSFQHLQEGVFRFRSLTEGESLAVRIANATGSPQYVVGITEIITNAVEHGNLGISYREKSELVEKGIWLKEVERRVGLPEHAEKYVQVAFKRDADSITLVVEDQGEGFDWKQYIEMDEVRVFDNHGRGIAITNKYLKVEFLEKGNKVKLTIPV
ncbi:MAG: response regulator [Ignavibacteriae bacterium]|nr:response regulator [Ignavibacteriota bacterium]